MQKVTSITNFGGRTSNQNFGETSVQMGIPPNPKQTGSKINLSPRTHKESSLMESSPSNKKPFKHKAAEIAIQTDMDMRQLSRMEREKQVPQKIEILKNQFNQNLVRKKPPQPPPQTHTQYISKRNSQSSARKIQNHNFIPGRLSSNESLRQQVVKAIVKPAKVNSVF